MSNNINNLELPGDAVYYTDGSVKENRASSAYVTRDVRYSTRITDDSTILQAELTAIQKALEHAIRDLNKRVIIHTDSLSAIYVLNKSTITENIEILSAIFYMCGQFIQKPVVHWIPSHF